MSPHSVRSGPLAEPFAGFEPIEANYIFCPNQFFDVCLRFYKRGVVRLVAYILLETLRTRDKEGNPVRQDIAASYQDLIRKAGISRGDIDAAIKEAIKAGFIVCVVEARRKTKGEPGQSAQYRLRWSEQTHYAKDTATFDGFFAGEGHRSPIPKSYFSHVVPSETLTRLRVVGAVLRFTVGYENQFGRREQAQMSLSFLQSFTNTKCRTTLSRAVKDCIDARYIVLVEAGRFSPDASEQRTATYGVRWLSQANRRAIGAKSLPEQRSKKPTSELVQESDQQPSRMPTSDGSKSRSANQFRNPTTRKKALKEKKQQRNVVAEVLLIAEGYEQQSAQQIANGRSLEVIRKQIAWIDERDYDDRLAMLRRSIESDWKAPARSAKRQQDVLINATRTQGVIEQEQHAVASDSIRATKQQEYLRRLQLWRSAPFDLKRQSYQQAMHAACNPAAKNKISKSTDAEPAAEVLSALDTLLTPAA